VREDVEVGTTVFETFKDMPLHPEVDDGDPFSEAADPVRLSAGDTPDKVDVADGGDGPGAPDRFFAVIAADDE
jgi:hypothetical protein